MSVEIEARGVVRGAFRLGDWLVEPSVNRVSNGGTITQLELKIMDVLVCLAERAGEVVTRQEIIDRVWATEYIADNTLSHSISEIRNALGDDPRNPSFIETIHRRGYRLIALVEPSVSDEAVDSRVARFLTSESADDRNPYPGLAAFTEADAEFFFGREAEVARMWRKLTSRKLLAVIGPSGVGKSSFLRAGVIPAKPEGWNVIICEPGEAPIGSLARSLVPEFAGDAELIASLVNIHEGDRAVAIVSRWRDRSRQALIIVDQFEELFTLNPPETQARFAEVLRRMVVDADIHVLLSMRDDFLYRCHDHDPLEPVFDALTPIKQPAGDALLRALIEPAMRRGYSFEDESLAAEMATEIREGRGALPLLAFAMARLWDQRDRDRRLLTRQAFNEIGAVGGALSRHAEECLQQAGTEKLPIARELFRNLVTADGTRTVREVDELLSVFSEKDREAAGQVVEHLIDARLLTSFKEEDVEGDARRRVEVVHESLLSSWPRLVRWQTQDADAAQLRDQLRQAARTWDEHDRGRDYLWTGKAHREFAVWKENYPGGLTELEDEFAEAMTAHARRRTRVRRFAVAAAFVVLVAVLGVVGVSRQQAISEANRAEAQKLLALGQLELDTDPTAALAWARAGLEIFDTHEGRLFALKALSKGPIARVIRLGDYARKARFSPDGEWLVFESNFRNLFVFRRSGGAPVFKDSFALRGPGVIHPFFNPSSDLLTVFGQGEIRSYSVPSFSEIDREEVATSDTRYPLGVGHTDRGPLTLSRVGDAREIELWRSDSQRERLMTIRDLDILDFDRSGDWAACLGKDNDRRVYLKSLRDASLPMRMVHVHEEPIADFFLHPEFEWFVVKGQESGTVTVWPLEGEADGPIRTINDVDLPRLSLDRRGGRIISTGMDEGNVTAHVWDLRLCPQKPNR